MESREKRKQKFYPPMRIPWVIHLLTVLHPILMRAIFRIERVEISREDLALLKQFSAYRGILVSNHATIAEPAVMFVVTRRLPGIYYFLAARDVFEEVSPFLRFWIHGAGAYSVDRGAYDRESIRNTVELFTSPKPCQIVMFPEGVTYYQNDTLLNFMPGAVHLGFLALEKWKKQGALPPFFLFPIAVKYCLTRDHRRNLDEGLKKMEQALSIPVHHGITREQLIQRLLFIGEAVLLRIESEYLYTVDAGWSINQRIQALKEWLLQKVEEKLGLSPMQADVVDRYRRLLYPVNRILYEDGAGLPPLSIQERQFIIKAMRRLSNFLVIYEGYVREHPTQERFVDTLHRLEREVFGSFVTKIWRRAFVRVGKPLDLTSFLPDYITHRTETMTRITREMEQRVSELLASLKVHQTPL